MNLKCFQSKLIANNKELKNQHDFYNILFKDKKKTEKQTS